MHNTETILLGAKSGEGYNDFMLALRRNTLISVLVLFCPICSCAQSRSVALTFDDLPAVGTADPDEVRSINIAILDSLERHHAPALGFVIGKRLQDIAKNQGPELLRTWVEGGYKLGNHTFSHTIADQLSAEEFENDIIAAEVSFSTALPPSANSQRYFRFPQNHTGDTAAKHDAIAAFLLEHRYKMAICTIENEDFAFNDTYLKILSKNDNASAARLRADYLAYTSAEIDYYTTLHQKIFGRETAQVMVLHVNRLNAEVINQLLDLFERKHYHFVSIDVALSDPSFNLPDKFLPKFSKFGPMWGYRWAEELHVHVNGALETEPPSWILEYGTGR